MTLALHLTFSHQEKEPPATSSAFPAARAAYPDTGFSIEAGNVKILSGGEETGEGERQKRIHPCSIPWFASPRPASAFFWRRVVELRGRYFPSITPK
jgi:hypothetical protein